MKKEIQDIEFDSVLDLYNLVKPALRTKLKEYGSLHIKTVYGIGYKYER